MWLHSYTYAYFHHCNVIFDRSHAACWENALVVLHWVRVWTPPPPILVSAHPCMYLACMPHAYTALHRRACANANAFALIGPTHNWLASQFWTSWVLWCDWWAAVIEWYGPSTGLHVTLQSWLCVLFRGCCNDENDKNIVLEKDCRGHESDFECWWFVGNQVQVIRKKLKAS